MTGLRVRSDDGSTSLSPDYQFGRTKFSGDGTGLAAATGSGNQLAAETGTGKGLMTGGMPTSNPNVKGLGNAVAGILSEYSKQQAEQAQASLDSVRPVVYQDPGRSNLGAELMTSSKKAKTPAKRGLGAMQRGRAGADPIDANGVRMLDIQAKHRKVEELRQKLAKLKAKKGVK